MYRGAQNGLTSAANIMNRRYRVPAMMGQTPMRSTQVVGSGARSAAK